MTATFYVGDAIETMNKLPEKSVDLVLTSPPFLALRSYLPADHPDKALEGGSQATPGEYVDWLLDVVEACARVLAPHGSLCFELGDTYAGSGGAGGDYLIGGIREGQPDFDGSAKFERHPGRDPWEADHPISVNRRNAIATRGNGWPLAKSLSLIPETFRYAMVYGYNPHTGRRTAPWRLRNVIRWVRPNPPVGALGDKFRPATSELMVFCKSKDRYFDLDSVRSAPDSPGATRSATLGSSALGPELRGTLDTDDDSFYAGWRCDFSETEIPVNCPVARLAEGFEVVELVGLDVRVEQTKRPYVVDFKSIGSPLTHPAHVAVAVESSLPGFFPVGTPIPYSSTPPSGAVLASPIGRTPDAIALKTAKVLSVHGRFIAPDRIAARITLEVDGALCAALLIAPITALDHQDNSTGKPCEHGQYKAHVNWSYRGAATCPGPDEVYVKPEKPATGDPKLQQALELREGKRFRNSGGVNVAMAGRTYHADGGAPPLDWWNIPLLEGEEPTRGGPKGPQPRPEGQASGKGPKTTAKDADAGWAWERTLINHPAGAPPLDWWNIPPGGYPGAHYAVWPPELLIKPIKAMCPSRVCRVCGEASRRIIHDRFGSRRQPDLAAHIKERRVAAGFTFGELNEWFGFSAIASHWEIPGPEQGRVPNPDVWPVLKERLQLSDDFDDFIYGQSRIEYLADGESLAPDERRTAYDRGGLPPTDGNRIKADRKAPDAFSDCSHDDWRPGLVLDPFAGSGTTLAVATGHGRDAIGIDLDERNYDLALDRVGPFILTRGEIPV